MGDKKLIMSSTGLVACYVTAPDESSAKKLAASLLHNRLAACVNVIPKVQSIYTWGGKVEESTEALMMIKTSWGRLEALKSKIKELHPYDVPEVIAVDIVGGNEDYLKWVEDLTD